MLACSLISKYLAFAFLSAANAFSHNVAVFPFVNYAPFCVLQSRIHDRWSSFFSSTLEDRQGYRPSDCFETFPFPEGFETRPQLEAAGKEYYEFRAALMVRHNEGLTKTYNRFHDPNDRSAEIQRLSMGASKPATHGRFKTSHGYGVLVSFRISM